MIQGKCPSFRATARFRGIYQLALQPTSPAVNKIPVNTGHGCITGGTDQRGQPRPDYFLLVSGREACGAQPRLPDASRPPCFGIFTLLLLRWFRRTAACHRWLLHRSMECSVHSPVRLAHPRKVWYGFVSRMLIYRVRVKEARCGAVFPGNSHPSVQNRVLVNCGGKPQQVSGGKEERLKSSQFLPHRGL
jgi:hypothetical protein